MRINLNMTHWVNWPYNTAPTQEEITEIYNKVLFYTSQALAMNYQDIMVKRSLKLVKEEQCSVPPVEQIKT